MPTASAHNREHTRPTAFQAGPGNRLRAARIEAGLTLASFAEAMCVSLASASRWETDVRRPHSSHLARLAHVLDRPAAEIARWLTHTPALSTESIIRAHGLRPLRLQASLSRAQLAEKIGVSVATIAHWECGRRGLPARRITPIAGALNLPPGEVLVQFRQPIATPPVSRLAGMRRAAGLTQRQVADGLNVTHPLICHWERGRSIPNWPQVRRLAVLFRRPVEQVAVAVGCPRPVYLDRTRWRSGMLPEILREVRRWRGDTVTDLAARIGVHPQTLRRWENGQTRPVLHLHRRLEVALALAPGSLPK
jgi:transcriptional regulator with XRE-family HTH domain